MSKCFVNWRADLNDSPLALLTVALWLRAVGSNLHFVPGALDLRSWATTAIAQASKRALCPQPFRLGCSLEACPQVLFLSTPGQRLRQVLTAVLYAPQAHQRDHPSHVIALWPPLGPYGVKSEGRRNHCSGFSLQPPACTTRWPRCPSYWKPCRVMC